MKGFKNLEASHLLDQGSVFHEFNLHTVTVDDIRVRRSFLWPRFARFIDSLPRNSQGLFNLS